jgi:hypothetical protein
MRVALIPPIPDLPYQATTDIHLLLSHLIGKPGYLEHYRERKNAGDYIILDNSAHENGHGNGAHELLFQARLVRADEVVCSDVLFDADGTVERTEKMLQYIASDHGWDTYFAAGTPRLMLVPQGTDEQSWARCLKRLMYVWDIHMSQLATAPPVIGVSKDYDDMVVGGIAHLIYKYIKPLRKRKVDVHCLGWPTNLWALADVAKKCSFVRSADSAKPFVYARAGIKLEPGGPVPDYPHRTDDYFETPLAKLTKIAVCNVEVFKAAASNELI